MSPVECSLSRMSSARPDYSGMTLNERLSAAGLLPDWDAAILAGDRRAAIDLLGRVDMDESRAIPAVNARLGKPMTALTRELSHQGLGERWYEWCDAQRDWPGQSTKAHADDSLLTDRGAFAALTIAEFMEAFRDAGAAVSKGSRFPPGRRSFTVEVRAGDRVANLAVQLGRGLNSMECSLQMYADGVPVGEAEPLHAAARSIRQARGEPDPYPNAPYPRPIIGSRSQLEVVSRELVVMLGSLK